MVTSWESHKKIGNFQAFFYSIVVILLQLKTNMLFFFLFYFYFAGLNLPKHPQEIIYTAQVI